MSKVELLEVTEELARQLRDRGIEDRVEICLNKEAGSNDCKRRIHASSPAAAINGLGVLILELAKELQVPVVHILSVLSVVLMGPAPEDE